ncbi:MAG: hypothetical protein ABIH63_03545 [archaeon]
MKKKFVKVYVADLLFFSLLLWFLVYARNRIFSYLVVIQQFTPQLNDIYSSLNMEDPASVAQLDALLKVIEPIVTEANFFIYFVVPVMVFLIWVFFQGLSWGLLKEDSFKKSLYIHFYVKFALLSIPFFVVLFFLLRGFLELTETVNLTKSVIIWIVLFIVFYFTLISYLVMKKKKLLFDIFEVGIKRAKVFFPAFLLFIVLFLIVFVLFFNAYISALSLVMPSASSIILLLFFVLLFSSSKCLLEFLSK